MREPVRVFCAYSRKDQQFRNALTAHLSGLSRNGLIVVWFDRFIDPGVDWNREIATQLDKAEIVLLLLSADFFASEYCMGVEYQRALVLAASGSLRTVPILLRDFYPRPPEIMKYQGLPSDGNPVTHWKDPDSAYADISRGIETVAREIRQLRAKPQTNDISGTSRVVRFSDTDVLGWVRVGFLALLRRKYSWRESTYTPTLLPNQCRAAVFGAWGTGLYGAPVLAETIQEDGRYQLLLHLGDVYYSGTEEEIRQRFLAPWPRVPGAISRALCGNHEMYSGGEAWLNAVTSEFGQESSYFSLQNDYWTLACLDSSYDDSDLHGRQVEWLKALLQGSDRKVILFTHHFPWSPSETPGDKLLAKLVPIIESTTKIVAWYWSHEHRCIVYDQHPTWKFFGRCIGHGGFPYRRLKAHYNKPHIGFIRVEADKERPGGEMLDGPNVYVRGQEQEYGPHGFVALEFNGPHLGEIMYHADGKELRHQTLA